MNDLQQIPRERTKEADQIIGAFTEYFAEISKAFAALAVSLEKANHDLYKEEALRTGETRHQAKTRLFGELYGKGTFNND